MIFKVAVRDGGTREGIIAQSLPRKAIRLAACGGFVQCGSFKRPPPQGGALYYR